MLKLRHIHKQFRSGAEKLTVVDDVNLDVAAGAFVTLLGPSGCGKTTTLRMIAGLETPSGGEIEIDGQPIFSSQARLNVPVNRRPIAMVFQSYAIWPHMNVFRNVAFPLQSGKFTLSRAEIRERTSQALAAVGLTAYAERDPSALSGGQQQRVALARALVSRPKVLLLDEPLSNLDVRLRDQMRDTIKELHETTKLTTIFVTHDQNEAMALSSQIVVMNAGKVVEIGPPQTIFEAPQSAFTAGFVGKNNVLEGTVSEAADGRLTVATAVGPVAAQAPAVALPMGQKVLVFIRPNSFTLERPGTAGITGVVKAAVYQGSYWEVKVALANGEVMLAHVSLSRARRAGLAAHGAVVLVADPDEVVVVAA